MSLEIPEIRTLLLSYPRSGNTWLRYCVETLTDKKTTYVLIPPYDTKKGLEELVGMGMSPMDKDSLVESRESQVILEKSHVWRESLDNIFTKENKSKLILMIRDYKESIPRHTNYNKSIYLEESQKFNNNLDVFDKTDLDKLIIYYEDLIISPKETLSEVLRFLNEYDEKKLNSFIESIGHHKSTSISIYDKFQGSRTKGKDLHAHKKKLNQSDLDYLDSLFTNKLINRYK